MQTSKATLLLAIILFTPYLAMSQNHLSPEGQNRKAAHDFLMGTFAEGKKLDIKGEGKSAILNEIVISTEPIDAKGEVLISLPEGCQRVASMFRYLILRGEGLDNLENLVMLPYDSTGTMTISSQTADLYRVKVPAMPIPAETMPAIQIKTRCKAGTTAKITEIAFNSQGKLSRTFDDIPYRNLGAEFPRKQLKVTLDLSSELSIAGHTDLEREKFCRYYAAPGNVHASFEKWAAERNFLPGRQIMKFQPALVVGYSKNQPKLSEHQTKKGAADLSFFDQYNNRAGVAYAIEPFRDIKYAMCFNDYPEFMSIEHKGRGTPLVEHFDQAAELAAAYLADQIKDTGRTATYWEVKNESTIKAEWDYHWRDKNSWNLLAEFHNKVADAVHEQNIATQIGGPSSAWMQLQVKDFSLYKSQRMFMDATKDHLDFYSHHFYEDIGSIGVWERRTGRYTNYLLGRLEAIMDMLRAHMDGTDNIKPILITECGSLQPGRGPSDYWLRLRSFSAYMHKFMQRPQEVDLVVPFAFMNLPWNPKSGDASFIPKDSKLNHAELEKCDQTPVAYFFELWRDFDGRRLNWYLDNRKTSSEIEPNWLDITAVHKGNQVQVALTNMSGRRLSVSLDSLLPKDTEISAVSQRRLYYQDGEIHFEKANQLDKGAAVPIDVEETTIVTIELSKPLQIETTVRRDFFYASETAIKTSANTDVEVQVAMAAPKAIQTAKLVIGVEKSGGLTGGIRGTINGHDWNAQADWAKDFNNLFAPIEIDISPQHLAKNNVIQINGKEGLTISSIHIVTQRKD